MTKTYDTCSFDGCSDLGRYLVSTPDPLCGGHYAQQYRGKSLTPIDRRPRLTHLDWPDRRSDGLCAAHGCELSSHARGLCRSHYSQIRKGHQLTPLNHWNKIIDGHKVCGVCGENKPVTSYGKHGGRIQHMCLSCRRVDSRMRAYGLTRDEVFALSELSHCEACGADIDSDTRNHHVDHCHETGRVRGVLCHGCNTALGLTGENPETLRRLAEYIESRSAVSA